MLAVLLFTLLQAAPATIPADLAAELKSIKAELSEVEKAEKALVTEQTAITKEEAHIADTVDLLNRGIATLGVERAARDKDYDDLMVEVNQAKQASIALSRQIDDYNGRCTGTFEESYYNACMAEKATLQQRMAPMRELGNRIDAWGSRIKAKSDALKKQEDMLHQINETILKDQNALQDRRDALNKNIDNLNDMKDRLNDRQNGALARLAEVNAISGDCAEIAKQITADSCKGKGDPSDPANWNTPCEKAARCLSKAFDGAR